MKPLNLKPVSKNSAENQAVDSLREYILSGEVKPGARLTEIALADTLGIARATLRTGLHRLASEGIMVQIPYTGWIVAELTPDDAWELWTLRGSLERLAAMLVAERASDAMLGKVKKAFEKLVKCCEQGNMTEINNADFALHRAMIEAADHSRLERQYQLVEQQVKLFIRASNDYESACPASIIEQHRPMVEAILNRDIEKAGYEAWRHNETEGSKLSEWLKTQPA